MRVMCSTLSWMKDRVPIPEIADIVRHWMPDANEDELKEATVNLREYLGAIYRIFLRHEAENRSHPICDNSEINDTVLESNDIQV